jgi:oligoribonuclease
MDFRQRYFVWIDLETTGLNPEKDDILEIAVILTDRNLKTISKYHTLVAGADLDKLDPVVKAMHIKSGLAEDLERCSNFPLQSEIEDDLYNLLPSRGIYYFAGSSVHFDVGKLEQSSRSSAAFSPPNVSTLSCQCSRKRPRCGRS